MASKLSSNPVWPRFNFELIIAKFDPIFVALLRLWKYALRIATVGLHNHLCTCLKQVIHSMILEQANVENLNLLRIYRKFSNHYLIEFNDAYIS